MDIVSTYFTIEFFISSLIGVASFIYLIRSNLRGNETNPPFAYYLIEAVWIIFFTHILLTSLGEIPIVNSAWRITQAFIVLTYYCYQLYLEHTNPFLYFEGEKEE